MLLQQGQLSVSVGITYIELPISNSCNDLEDICFASNQKWMTKSFQ